MKLETKGLIGVFDSGAGGLTVLKELVKTIHGFSFIYYADSINCPYGPKGKDEIIRLSTRIVDRLIEKGCQVIVVACNTATAAAIDYLRQNYFIPFVGMEPAVKPAALATITKSIGVLATEGTFNGRLFQETTSRYAEGITVNYRVGDGLVELIEAGKANATETAILLDKYLQPMLQANIDQLVLGCTHYPFLIPTLRRLLPGHIHIIDPAPAVAVQAKRIAETLKESVSIHEKPYVAFYSSGNMDLIRNLVMQIEVNENVPFPDKFFYDDVSW